MGEENHLTERFQEMIESIDDRQKEHTKELYELRKIIERQVLLEERHQQNASAIERAFAEINTHAKALTTLDRSRFFLQGALWSVGALSLAVAALFAWALRAQLDIAQNLPVWKYEIDSRITSLERTQAPDPRQH